MIAVEYLLAALGLVSWAFGGLVWLSWLTNRHAVGCWWPSWWQTLLAGPLAWFLVWVGGNRS